MASHFGRAIRWSALLLGLLVFAACSGDSGAGASHPATAARTAPATAVPSPPSIPSAALPAIRHVFLIVMENKSYAEIIGNPAAPYLNQLAASYGLATNYFGVAHPSLPNYLALVAGDTFGVRSDCTNCFQSAPNLVDELEAAGRDWKGYMEDLPAPCSTAVSAGRYDLKHDPFLYLHDIRDRPQRCRRVVPLTELSRDLTADTVPAFAWITPNENHNTHDTPVETGDTWLHGIVPSILASPAWSNGGLLLVTWDEGSDNAGCCGAPGGGQVALLAIAPEMRHGARTGIAADHYSLLRAIEDLWQLPPLGHSRDASSAWLAELLAP